MSEMRICRICEQKKPLQEFEIDSRYEGAYTSRCRVCKAKSRDKATHAFYKLCQRASKAGSPVEVTLEQVKTLFEIADGTCLYCGAKEDPNGRAHALEHIRARSEGGRDHISNLTVACNSCNSRKQSKPLVTHMFDDENFRRENFGLIAHYVALTSGQSLEDVVMKMTEEHVEHIYNGIITDLDKLGDSGYGETQ
jgi:5-methylcytosine-specific restriction endonuclease McrA